MDTLGTVVGSRFVCVHRAGSMFFSLWLWPIFVCPVGDWFTVLLRSIFSARSFLECLFKQTHAEGPFLYLLFAVEKQQNVSGTSCTGKWGLFFKQRASNSIKIWWKSCWSPTSLENEFPEMLAPKNSRIWFRWKSLSHYFLAYPLKKSGFHAKMRLFAILMLFVDFYLLIVRTGFS